MQVASGAEPGRDRYVDFLRVAAIGAVVFGHWLVTSPTYVDGQFGAADVLHDVRWAPWVTWGFQVMPIFFLVGGFAAGRSWGAARGTGNAQQWLRRRAVRLLGPTTWYVAVALIGMSAAAAAGVPSGTRALAGWAVALHLWFLPVYLVLTLLTPALYAAHRRAGLAVPAVMALLGVGVDVVVITMHVKALGWANYVLIWGAAYQLGFCWQDGTLTRRRRDPLLLAAVGAAVFIALEWSGLFPVSLIGMQGQSINNTAPPSVALAAYAAAQLGILVALAPAASRWLRRPRLWRFIEVCNTEVMTVYLWHMLPVVLGGVLLYVTGAMPQPTVGSAEWWVLRPAWIGCVAVLLAPLVLLSRRLRRPAYQRTGKSPEAAAADRATRGAAATGHAVADQVAARGAAPLLWVATGLTSFALARFAIAGFAPDGRPPVTAAVVYGAGILLVTVDAVLPRRRRATPPSTAPV
ncbi:MAG TPA: acyltransferase [Actinocrinis sp.]|uniref:acyltransferase family protein n=1 Tax=Actinocrinis sp. TaxID=1920516 RepID=UPI002DDD9D20|nr:acyltransferase [Actinocrinis sp.]HEV3173610.1 acyltransferase [Actinocrinis sp.]